jgi:hypothetical protein
VLALALRGLLAEKRLLSRQQVVKLCLLQVQQCCSFSQWGYCKTEKGVSFKIRSTSHGYEYSFSFTFPLTFGQIRQEEKNRQFIGSRQAWATPPKINNRAW